MIYAALLLTTFVGILGALYYNMAREFNSEFSLNPGWDSTRDFIDAIPTYKGGKKK